MTTIRNAVKTNKFQPLKGKIFVTDMEHGMRLTRGGLILPDDNMTERGVHPRWGKVHSLGEGVDYVSPGEWVLVKHGRWTTGIDIELDGKNIRLWGIEPESIELVYQGEGEPFDHIKHNF
jgi:co-chaperonin GroES (HSP10)